MFPILEARAEGCTVIGIGAGTYVEQDIPEVAAELRGAVYGRERAYLGRLSGQASPLLDEGLGRVFVNYDLSLDASLDGDCAVGRPGVPESAEDCVGSFSGTATGIYQILDRDGGRFSVSSPDADGSRLVAFRGLWSARRYDTGVFAGPFAICPADDDRDPEDDRLLEDEETGTTSRSD